jgi:hypothetical protein
MDIPLDLDLGTNFDTNHFSFLMDSPRPQTPALANASAVVSTPPSSLSLAIQGPSAPAQLWTPAFLRLVSDLYTAPHGTTQRFDRTLLLARQGLDFVISYLPDVDSCNTLGSAFPNSPLVCVIIVQQVLASYKSLKSQISSRLLSSNLTSSNARPSSASSIFLPESTNDNAGEAVYIGSFEVEGIESQCHVLKAIVNLEIERFKKVLTRLEEWTEELSRDGKGEEKLAHQIVVALKALLSATS